MQYKTPIVFLLHGPWTSSISFLIFYGATYIFIIYVLLNMDKLYVSRDGFRYGQEFIPWSSVKKKYYVFGRKIINGDGFLVFSYDSENGKTKWKGCPLPGLVPGETKALIEKLHSEYLAEQQNLGTSVGK